MIIVACLASFSEKPTTVVDRVRMNLDPIREYAHQLALVPWNLYWNWEQIQL